jgi:hypothetical protein
MTSVKVIGYQKKDEERVNRILLAFGFVASPFDAVDGLMAVSLSARVVDIAVVETALIKEVDRNISVVFQNPANC